MSVSLGLMYPMSAEVRPEERTSFISPIPPYELNVYKIYGKKPGKTLMPIKIAEPFLEYLILKLNDHIYALRDGERILADTHDCLTFIATKSNINEEQEIRARANGYLLSPGDTRRIRDIAGRNAKTLRIDLQRESLLFGKVFIELGRVSEARVFEASAQQSQEIRFWLYRRIGIFECCAQ